MHSRPLVSYHFVEKCFFFFTQIIQEQTFKDTFHALARKVFSCKPEIILSGG